MEAVMISNKKITTILICLFLSIKIQAQLSEGGSPLSFSLREISDISTITMPPVDVESLIQEDQARRNDKTLRPFRFGNAIDVDIDIKRFGTFKRLDNGDKLWLLKIHSEGAYSINLIYNRFKLSKGSKFFIYNEDKTMILGAYTELNNNRDEVFATDLVQGSTITLEYYEPEYSDDGIINISSVIHGYINTFNSSRGDYGPGQSEDCHNDVNCWQGASLQCQKRGVARIVTGENFCSGCLINNTSEDGTPYFLTAMHCYFDWNNRWNTYDQKRYPSQSIFNFRFWRSDCDFWKQPTPAPDSISFSGADLVAFGDSSDFALLKLRDTIPGRSPKDYNLYFAGWNINTGPGSDVTGIHHPKGDVMKISFGYINGYVAYSGDDWGPTGNSLWEVGFSSGVTQKGSSGSPLFNSAGQIVGQAMGQINNPFIHDSLLCLKQSILRIAYGQLGCSWGESWDSTKLKYWLGNASSFPGKHFAGKTAIRLQNPDGSFDTVLKISIGCDGVPDGYNFGDSIIKIKYTQRCLDDSNRIYFPYGMDRMSGAVWYINGQKFSNYKTLRDSIGYYFPVRDTIWKKSNYAGGVYLTIKVDVPAGGNDITGYDTVKFEFKFRISGDSIIVTEYREELSEVWGEFDMKIEGNTISIEIDLSKEESEEESEEEEHFVLPLPNLSGCRLESINNVPVSDTASIDSINIPRDSCRIFLNLAYNCNCDDTINVMIRNISDSCRQADCDTIISKMLIVAGIYNSGGTFDSVGVLTPSDTSIVHKKDTSLPDCEFGLKFSNIPEGVKIEIKSLNNNSQITPSSFQEDGTTKITISPGCASTFSFMDKTKADTLEIIIKDGNYTCSTKFTQIFRCTCAAKYLAVVADLCCGGMVMCYCFCFYVTLSYTDPPSPPDSVIVAPPITTPLTFYLLNSSGLQLALLHTLNIGSIPCGNFSFSMASYPAGTYAIAIKENDQILSSIQFMYDGNSINAISTNNSSSGSSNSNISTKEEDTTNENSSEKEEE